MLHRWKAFGMGFVLLAEISSGSFSLNGTAAQSAENPGENTPLYFTYSIHVHWTTDQPGAALRRSDFEEIKAAVQAIATTLNKHDAKGTFLVVPNLLERCRNLKAHRKMCC